MVPPPLRRCHRHHRRHRRPRHNNNNNSSMMGSTSSALDDYVMSILQSRNASEFKVVTDAAALPTNELLDQVYSSRYTTRNSCNSSNNNNNTTSDHSRISLDFTTLKDDFYSEEEEECKKYRLEQSTIMEMDISDWLSGDSSCEHHQSSSSCFQKDLPSSSSSYNDIMRRPSDVPQAKIAVPRSA